MEATFIYYRSIFAIAFVLLAACPKLAATAPTEWPGFRGLDRQGAVEQSASASEWKAPEVRWRTAIPGNGHSSPVVANGRIYLTTSYESRQTAIFRQASLAVGLVSLVILIATATFLLTRYAGKARLSPWGSAYFLSLVTFGLGIAGLATLALFGRTAFDFARCPIRNWLGMNLAITMAVFLCEYRARTATRWSLFRGLLYLALAAWLIAGMPSRHHAFRLGLLGPSAMLVLALAGLPAVIGVSRIGGWLMARFDRSAEHDGPMRPKTSPTTLAGAALVLLLVAGGIAIGIRLIVAPGEGDLPISVPRGPLFVAWTLLMAALGTMFGAWLLARQAEAAIAAPEPSRWRMAIGLLAVVVVVAAGSGIVALVAAKAIAGSSYLTYHLGVPRWESEYGAGGLAAVVAAAILAAIAAIAIGPRAARAGKVASRTLVAATVVLCMLCLANAWLPPGERTNVRAIISLDEATGQVLWRCEGLTASEGPLHVCNSPATPTAVVTGDRVCAFFGAGVMCSDLDGKRLWENPNIRFYSVYGVGASPVASDSLLVIPLGTLDSPCLVALDLATGREVWRTAWEPRPSFNISGNSRTPIIMRIGGEEQVVVWKFEHLAGYRLSDGSQQWNYKLGTSRSDLVSSPTADDQRVYCACPEEIIALDRQRLGEPEAPVVWRTAMKKRGPNCSSPLVVGGKLLTVTDYGQVYCLDAATGEELWKERLKGRYFASPFAVGAQVFFTNLDGTTTVLRTDGEPRKLTEFGFGEGIYASPAPTLNGGVLQRTEKTLLCLEPASAAGGTSLASREH